MEAREKLLQLLKAKYISRKRGKGGKYEYEYAKDKKGREKKGEEEVVKRDRDNPTVVLTTIETKEDAVDIAVKYFQGRLPDHIAFDKIRKTIQTLEEAGELLSTDITDVATDVIWEHRNSLNKLAIKERNRKVAGRKASRERRKKFMDALKRGDPSAEAWVGLDKTEIMSKATDKLSSLLKAKYIKRVPKSGGGFRYYYTREKDKKEGELTINKEKVGKEDKGKDILSQAKSQFQELKKVKDQIKEIKEKAEKEQLSLPELDYDPNAKDSMGRQESYDQQIKGTLQYAKYIENMENLGIPTKEELQSKIDALSKKKRIGIQDKKILSRNQELLNNYDSEFSKRNQMIESVKKYKNIQNRINKEIEPLKEQQEKIEDKLNIAFRNLPFKQRSEMHTLKNKIMYGMGKAKEPVNSLQKAQIPPWQLNLLKLDQR